MSKLPKFKIKLPFEHVADAICDLEQVRHRFNWGHEQFLIVVDNRVINSYEELVELVKQERFRDTKLFEIELQDIEVGG